MTAEEWVRSTFMVNDNAFQVVNAGDYEQYAPKDSNRITSGYAPVATFLEYFGPVISNALASGQNPVDALIALPSGLQRGWGSIFKLWKAKGIGL